MAVNVNLGRSMTGGSVSGKDNYFMDSSAADYSQVDELMKSYKGSQLAKI